MDLDKLSWLGNFADSIILIAPPEIGRLELEFAETAGRYALIRINGLPPAELDRLRQDWDEERVKPLSDEDRQEFVDGWGKLVAPDFVDRTMAEITPQLNELKGQLGPMIGFGAMMAVGSIEQSQELTATQKAQATKLLNAAAAWAGVAISRTTAPMSNLWTTSSDSTLIATGKPTSSATRAASSGERATALGSTGSRYASSTFIASEGVR